MGWSPCRWLILTAITFSIVTGFSKSESFEGKNGTEVSRAESRGLGPHVRPANTMQKDDETGENRGLRETESDKEIDIRPFEWLHKHLTDYLMCTYSEHQGCERKLAKAIKLEQVSSRLDELKHRKNRINSNSQALSNRHRLKRRTDSTHTKGKDRPGEEIIILGGPSNSPAYPDHEEPRDQFGQPEGVLRYPDSSAPFMQDNKFGPPQFGARSSDKPYSSEPHMMTPYMMVYPFPQMPFGIPHSRMERHMEPKHDLMEGQRERWKPPFRTKFPDYPDRMPYRMMGNPLMMPFH